jgi:hypothetical protein
MWYRVMIVSCLSIFVNPFDPPFSAFLKCFSKSLHEKTCSLDDFPLQGEKYYL